MTKEIKKELPDMRERVRRGFYWRQSEDLIEKTFGDLEGEALQGAIKNTIHHAMLADLQQVCEYFLPFLPFIVIVNLINEAKFYVKLKELVREGSYEQHLFDHLQMRLSTTFNFSLETMEHLYENESMADGE